MNLIYFCFQILVGTKIGHTKKGQKTTAVMTAEYFYMLQCWLELNCEGLKTSTGWRKFYATLVRTLTKKSKTKIDPEQVLVPPQLQDVLQVCRLLYQAISDLQIGICDGQHRMGAMLGALFNWEITANYPVSDDKPPCTFQRVEAASIPPKDLDGILSCLSENVMVRVFAPESIEKFEEQSVAYSLARERSQRAHKP